MEMEKRFDDLYTHLGPSIYARCRRLLGDDAEAEDAVQEVFFRTYPHLHRLSTNEDAMRWLYRVSTNTCLHVLRKRKRPLPLVSEVVDPGAHSPEALLVNQNLVRKMFRLMPEKLAVVAAYYYLDDFNQARIAELLGVTRRSVVNRLAEFKGRARKTLVRQELVT